MDLELVFLGRHRLQLPLLSLLVSLGLLAPMKRLLVNMRMTLGPTHPKTWAQRAITRTLNRPVLPVWPMFLDMTCRVLMLKLELALLRMVNPGPSSLSRSILVCPPLLLEKFLPMEWEVNPGLTPRCPTVVDRLPVYR